MFHIFNNSSGGRARRDFECVQGGSGSLLVQRQSQHQGWGAGLWDGHQMDKTRLQLQSSGNKKKKRDLMSVFVKHVCSALLWRCGVLYQNEYTCMCIMRQRKWGKTLVTTDSTDTVCLQLVPLFYQLSPSALRGAQHKNPDKWLLVLSWYCSSTLCFRCSLTQQLFIIPGVFCPQNVLYS